NEHGELGEGTINPIGTTIRGRGKYPPVRVSGLGNIVAAAAGGHHTLALGSDGRVWAWGDNWNCQLGLGTKSQAEPSPRRVMIE
ncbi:MAG: hypothetical protein K6U03_07695, partial [Firmicutes bacterium]|nr:hypothetical protein [Bacillota bacterium]